MINTQMKVPKKNNTKKNNANKKIQKKKQAQQNAKRKKQAQQNDIKKKNLNKYQTSHDNPENPAEELSFPNFFQKVFVITINSERYDRFKNRVCRWEKYTIMWPGTVGENVKIANNNPKLKLGELGCYDSHYQIWKHMVENNYDNVLILEDDVDMIYCDRQSKALCDAVDVLTQHTDKWDIFYLYFRSMDDVKTAMTVTKCENTCGYVLTLTGAKNVLNYAIPISDPVDVFLTKLHLKNHIQSWRLHKRIAWQWSPIDNFKRNTIK